MTFLESMNVAGEYMLNKALGTVDAGACVGSGHQTCGPAPRNTYCGHTSCNPSIPAGFYHFYSCFGACVRSGQGFCC